MAVASNGAGETQSMLPQNEGRQHSPGRSRRTRLRLPKALADHCGLGMRPVVVASFRAQTPINSLCLDSATLSDALFLG